MMYIPVAKPVDKVTSAGQGIKEEIEYYGDLAREEAFEK